LTSHRITNGIAASVLKLMGANGSITYGTLEILNINLGSSTGNAFTIESTHGNGSVTFLTSGDGRDVINVETINGDTSIDAGAGNDTIRIGDTTGQVGQIDGIIDAFTATVNSIDGRLTIIGGAGTEDSLKVYDGGDTERENGKLTNSTITGMGLLLGVTYQDFEELKIFLSDNDNGFFIESTHTGVTFLDTGDETPKVNGTNDVVNIQSISGPTTIKAGNGNDTIRVNYFSNGKQTFVSGIDGELTLHGQFGSDRYEIGLAGQISSRINVFDQSKGDPGIDRLRIFGTNEIDFFLLRGNQNIGLGMVAAIEVDENREPVGGGGGGGCHRAH